MKTIRRIPTELTIPIRHQALYPNRELALARTEDDAQAQHYGLFLDTTCVAVITKVNHPHAIQLRKFATVPEFQNQGYGSMLLNHVLSLCTGRVILNARIEKSSFYSRFGFKQTGHTLSRNNIDYCEMEILL